MSTPAAAPRRRWPRRLAIALLAVAGLLMLVVAAAGLWLRHRMTADLPVESGTLAAGGLAAPVAVERDAHGVPTLRGASRRDVAFATGFVHAQDRYFQMDLLRRRAAGELAELVGRGGLASDRAMRIHLFREHARRVVAASPPDIRQVLQSYAAGVNAGLRSLGAPPFEYLVLRTAPSPWREEDSVLVLFAMFTQLADVNGANESALSLMRDKMPPALFRFLTPEATEWEAPLAGTPPAAPPPPAAEEFDLRRPARAATEPGRGHGPEQAAAAGVQRGDDGGGSGGLARAAARDEQGGGGEVQVRAAAGGEQGAGGEGDGWEPPSGAKVAGEIWVKAGAAVAAVAGGGRPLASNSWAVAGRLTADGGALLADELHLGLGVPNIWYRAVLEWPAAGGAGAPPQRIAGVTLPGAPVVVVGSNGRVAWGVTNSALDTSDLVVIDPDPAHPDRYLTPGGPLAFERHREALKVKGEADRPLAVDWTIWGPVVGQDWQGRRRAVRAVADLPEGADFNILRLETAGDVGQALDIAAASGLPALNFTAVDAGGRIGWTIAGRLPRRSGFDGATDGTWAGGRRRWDGLVPAAAVPRVVDPPLGRLWSANNRVLAGEAAANLGRGGYVLGVRALQIRDDLLALPRATADDMRRIQLDDRAVFMARWRDLLLRVLTPQALAGHPQRAEMRRLVERWDGRAGVGSVSYRLVRTFRYMATRDVFKPLTAACQAADADFHYSESVNQYEGPLWQLVTRRPANLLQPRYRTWDEQLLAAVDDAIDLLLSKGPRLADRTWGERNTLAMEHPMSDALPVVGRYLSMPPRPLPGDDEMPRVQGPDYGATLRMVVSPGRERQGILEMPGGESGNPLSPHYGDLLDDWCTGAPAPLLPGKTAAVLRLVPGGGPAP